MASGFLFNGAAAHHRAILSRNMPITALAASDVCATALSVFLGISMAALGMGYWALAGMAVCPSIVGLVAAWTLTRWIPDLPRRGAGIASMLKYGGTVLIDNFIMDLAYKIVNVFPCPFWGARGLRLFGAAHDLLYNPNENISKV